VEVRLEDFYAPELNALGGREAKEALESVTKGKRLSCLASHRSYDRIVATCKIGTASVGDLMRRRVLEGGNGHSASR
jgi:endonuclease YncB( thermonuclease family)